MVGGSCAVLVVEDDDQIRALFAAIITAEGFAVRTAANGREALAVLQHWRPDLIILDLEMPEMDGRAFRAEQRRTPQLADIPVIVMSAAPDVDAQVAGLEAAETLPKPCDLEVLAAAIRRVVQG
jgi:DNA-binding response OmpR family regulator